MNLHDDELERRLHEWLEANARPMPLRLRAAVQEMPEKRAQLGRQRWPGGSRLQALAAAVVATSTLVVAVVLGSGMLRDLGQAVGGAGTIPPSPSDSSAPTSEPVPGVYEWNAPSEFVDRNPAPDNYGHTTVWTYLSGPAGVLDPAQYEPLPAVEGGERPAWYDPAFDGLEIALSVGTDRLQIQPGGGGADSRAAILAWRNPVEAVPLRVIGSVEVDGSCGDGIFLVIAWQRGDDGAEIQTIHLSRGAESFDIFLDEFDPGALLYFGVEPGGDSRCDTTWLEVTIHAPATRDDPPRGGNDDFGDALEVADLPFAWSGDLGEGTTEVGEPFGCYNGASADLSVWFVWTVPDSGTMRVITGAAPGDSQPSGDTNTAIFGPFDGVPAALPGIDDLRFCVNGVGAEFALVEAVSAGETYLFQLSAVSTTESHASVSIELEQVGR